MKKVLIFFLLASLNVGAQSFIQKKDGSKIAVETVHVEPGNKRLSYFLKDDKKEFHVKFNELDYASWGDFLFKTFMIDGKAKGYYAVAESKEKTLVTTKRIRIKSRGGFESTYTHYEVTVLDKQNKAIETLSFTDENSEKKSAERSKVLPMIKNHFSDCPKLIEKAAAFESPASDAKTTTILVFLNDPVYVKCE